MKCGARIRVAEGRGEVADQHTEPKVSGGPPVSALICQKRLLKIPAFPRGISL